MDHKNAQELEQNSVKFILSFLQLILESCEVIPQWTTEVVGTFVKTVKKIKKQCSTTLTSYFFSVVWASKLNDSPVY